MKILFIIALIAVSMTSFAQAQSSPEEMSCVMESYSELMKTESVAIAISNVEPEVMIEIGNEVTQLAKSLCSKIHQ